MKETERREKPGREKSEPKPHTPKEKLSAEDSRKEFTVRKVKILLVTCREWFGSRS